MVQTWQCWAPALPSSLALIVGAGVPIGLTWAVRRVRVEGRSLPRAALGWLSLWSVPPKGQLRGRPHREHRAVSLVGVHMNVAADPDDEGRACAGAPHRGRRAVKPPARALVGNLIWSTDGGVWAVWRVAPFAHAHTLRGRQARRARTPAGHAHRAARRVDAAVGVRAPRRVGRRGQHARRRRRRRATRRGARCARRRPTTLAETPLHRRLYYVAAALDTGSQPHGLARPARGPRRRTWPPASGCRRCRCRPPSSTPAGARPARSRSRLGAQRGGSTGSPRARSAGSTPARCAGAATSRRSTRAGSRPTAADRRAATGRACWPR